LKSGRQNALPKATGFTNQTEIQNQAHEQGFCDKENIYLINSTQLLLIK
jgi:hypothetical protein